MFSQKKGLPELPMDGGELRGPKLCEQILKEHPEYKDKLLNCIVPAEAGSRLHHGRCRNRCCLNCRYTECVNTRVKHFTRKDGTEYTRIYNAVCPVAKKGEYSCTLNLS